MDALESSPCATSRLGDQHSSGGRYFGNYCLIRPIGQGSFATIYLAKHRYLGTTAAIKVLHRHATDVAVRRFLYEARITARLVHPHIIRVLEYDVEQGTPFLVMDYAAYGSMYDYMRQSFPAGTPLTPRQALRYVWPIASALYYMHCCGFIHRDVKPANILLGSGGQVWLSDLGIALPARGVGKSTQADRIGTAAYAAPEQFRGLPCFASDQYALGVMVYEWLCGALPFTGSSDEVARQHMNVPPLPLQVRVPHLSLAVERVVLKALAKEPGERFDSVEEFALALEQACEDDREVSSQPGSPPQEMSSKGDAGARGQEAAQGVEATIAPGSLLPPQDGERASDEAHLPVFSLLKKTLIIVAISVASELVAYAVLAFLGVDMRSIWLLLLSWLFALPLAALAASEQWNMLPLAGGILLIAVACGLLFHSLILFCIVDCLLLAACLADVYLLKKRPNC